VIEALPKRLTHLLSHFIVAMAACGGAPPNTDAPIDRDTSKPPTPVGSTPSVTVVRECHSQGDCPYELACTGGRCGPCIDKKDCPSDGICRDGQCIELPM